MTTTPLLMELDRFKNALNMEKYKRPKPNPRPVS